MVPVLNPTSSNHRIEDFHKITDSESFSFFNALSLVLILGFQRDYPVSKRATSARVVFLTSCLCLFIIYSHYTALLTSNMISRAPAFNIRSFEDLLNTDCHLLIWKATVPHEYLEKAPAGSPKHTFYTTRYTAAILTL